MCLSTSSTLTACGFCNVVVAFTAPQWDGVGNTTEEKVLLIGATNRPQELDSAALRRMPKRLCIYALR
jgi:SpoVK/Ycf46/Vps4 family AAA+-type ATPase